MRIESFWAKNYRSLRDVRLESLAPFNVFYGSNGAGKSNVLAALETLFGFIYTRTWPQLAHDLHKPVSHRDLRGFLSERDRCQHAPFDPIVIGAVVQLADKETSHFLEEEADSEVTLTLEVCSRKPGEGLAITTLSIGGDSERDLALWAERADNASNLQERSDYAGLLAAMLPRMHRLAKQVYALVGADRMLRFEQLAASQTDEPLDVAELLARNQLKEALLLASKHPNPLIRRRYRQLQELMADQPLRRRPFEVIHDVRTGEVQIVEHLDDAGDQPREVALDLTGHGIAHVYSILAQILLRGTRVVAIEEPEVHLHVPTTGAHLRQLFDRLIAEGYIDQLFITTHSGLFDLDPAGYWDVALGSDGSTSIVRKQPDELSIQHLG